MVKPVNGLTFPEMVQSEPEELYIATPPSPFQTVQAVPVPPPVAKQFFCTNCGNPVAEQAVACMSCGAKPVGHKKFCRQCGVGLNPEQVVCIKCGSSVNTGGVNFAGWSQSGMNGVNFASNFLQANNITTGEAVIFVAAALAFLSFLLPWTEAMVPTMGKVASNGFSTYAFLLGIIFIFPVWLALAKHRYIYGQVIGYACAVRGFILGAAQTHRITYMLLYTM